MKIPFEPIQSYRSKTFRLLPGQRLKSKEEAIDYVNQRGFVYFWPITGIPMPSLWTAVAGDRRVADEHDDPGHVTWGWKDDLLGKRAWYYAKILRKKATMVAFDLVPYFYALSENYGSPEEDYLTIYEQGRLTLEAKTVYETILDEGPIDTIALRRAAHMTSKASNSRFERALRDLQADFKILPVGVAPVGAWRYAFMYEIMPRVYPEVLEQARPIGERQARQKLTEIYFRSLGAAQLRDVKNFFGWRPAQVERAVEALVGDGVLRHDLEIENQPGEWAVLSELIIEK